MAEELQERIPLIIKELDSRIDILKKASLIHQLNTSIIESSEKLDVHEVTKLVFSEKLLNQLVQYLMVADSLHNIALRTLEFFSYDETARAKIVETEAIDISFGLLRSKDYETIVATLSFLDALLAPEVIHLFNRRPRLRLFLSLLKMHQLEYIPCILDIVELTLQSKQKFEIISLGFRPVLEEIIRECQELKPLQKTHRKLVKLHKDCVVWEKFYTAQVEREQNIEEEHTDSTVVEKTPTK
mmetsp:Transcript_42667/g.49031  ORF Transcript_42667/g.49031 Transcript_42667/m.49031 type:complete len:242 (-) Transcript_42667:258-983(-)